MPNAPKTPARAVRISDEVWAALREIADQHRVTVSDVIRLALDDFILRHRSPASTALYTEVLPERLASIMARIA